jgi:hypothetical protein
MATLPSPLGHFNHCGCPAPPIAFSRLWMRSHSITCSPHAQVSVFPREPAAIQRGGTLAPQWLVAVPGEKPRHSQECALVSCFGSASGSAGNLAIEADGKPPSFPSITMPWIGTAALAANSPFASTPSARTSLSVSHWTRQQTAKQIALQDQEQDDIKVRVDSTQTPFADLLARLCNDHLRAANPTTHWSAAQRKPPAARSSTVAVHASPGQRCHAAGHPPRQFEMGTTDAPPDEVLGFQCQGRSYFQRHMEKQLLTVQATLNANGRWKS